MFTDLPLCPDIVNTLQPLLQQSTSNMEVAAIAQLIQHNISLSLQVFREGSVEERRYYLILQHAYIKKMGTHEVVSEHLNIPIKSYYRYLKSAVQSLAYEMIKTT